MNQTQITDNNINKINEESSIIEDSHSIDISIQKERAFRLGKKIKELDNIQGINDTVILVNGCAITKKDVEKKKIHGEFSNSFSLKNGIEELIQEKAIETEAIRLEIEPSKDEINNYLEMVRSSIESNPNSVEIQNAYLEGRGITREEYFKELEKVEYKNFQHTALWEAVKPKEKIQSEATERNIDVNDVDSEYHAKYISDLVDKSQISIFDSEIKEILSD